MRDFLAAVDRLPSALLIEGEAGIGKTTLWSAGIAAAAEHGYRVLSARPADLLDPVLERALDELPPPQRRALEIALVLRDPENGVPDQAAIAFALLGALRSAVTDVPVVVAVDVSTWLCLVRCSNAFTRAPPEIRSTPSNLRTLSGLANASSSQVSRYP